MIPLSKVFPDIINHLCTDFERQLGTENCFEYYGACRARGSVPPPLHNRLNCLSLDYLEVWVRTPLNR